MKNKETIEEATEKYWAKQPYNEDAFIAGAKWQQKRMYSEDDLKEAFENGVGSGKYQQEYGIKGSMNFNEWFEQFKKK
jgi:hypothetical protein